MRLWEGEGGDREHVRLVQEGLVDAIGEEIRIEPPAAAPPRRQPRNAAPPPDRNRGIGVVEVRWNGNVQVFVEEENVVFDDDDDDDFDDGSELDVSDYGDDLEPESVV